MKAKYKISAIFLVAIILLVLAPGCSDKLEEHPYTVFPLDFFKTASGIQDGLNSAYAGLRYGYGPEGSLTINNVGTDEFSLADQDFANPASASVYNNGTYTMDNNDGSVLIVWNNFFSMINTCNAVIYYAPQVGGLSAANKTNIVAQARCLRAVYYLYLVGQFGAVPVDLGAGDLQFNINPSTEFHRLPVDELLTKDYQAIIDDLTFAKDSLTNVSRPTGNSILSQAAALHWLAKAYLHRGYSSAKQGTDFQSAYITAKVLIDNESKYNVALQTDYSDIHRVGNEYNCREILYDVERKPLDDVANEYQSVGTDFANKSNIALNEFNCNYQATLNVGGDSVPKGSNDSNPAHSKRNFQYFTDRPLQYSRPLRRFSPTAWLLDSAFADKINDSRYDNSFRCLWLAATYNSVGTSGYISYVNNIAKLGMKIGDTAILIVQTNHIADSLMTLHKNYAIIAPRSRYDAFNNRNINIYPALKKYDDPNRANFNDASGRPFIVAKYSETILIAAEAAFQLGNSDDAATLINRIRERAAYRSGLSAGVLSARKVAMDVTGAQITLDFILDERSRELCGESLRWPDLAVRGKLIDRVTQYNKLAAPNIRAFHALRPIPLSQLNAISDADKDQYQNPGYRTSGN